MRDGHCVWFRNEYIALGNPVGHQQVPLGTYTAPHSFLANWTLILFSYWVTWATSMSSYLTQGINVNKPKTSKVIIFPLERIVKVWACDVTDPWDIRRGHSVASEEFFCICKRRHKVGTDSFLPLNTVICRCDAVSHFDQLRQWEGQEGHREADKCPNRIPWVN